MDVVIQMASPKQLRQMIQDVLLALREKRDALDIRIVCAVQVISGVIKPIKCVKKHALMAVLSLHVVRMQIVAKVKNVMVNVVQTVKVFVLHQ